MIVKCIKEYNSSVLKRIVKVGEVLEVEDARGAQLISANVADEEPEKKPEEKPEPEKKATRKRREKKEG